MRQHSFLSAICLLALSACGAEQAANEPDPATAQEAAIGTTDSPVVRTYVDVRKKAAVGDIEGAAQLTDDPAAYTTQMTTAIERIGQEKFAENMKNAALTINIESEKHAGDFAMLIINFSFKGQNEKVANFFQKNGDQYVEIVSPDDKIPCKLVRDFYDARGDKEAAVKNCSEKST